MRKPVDVFTAKVLFMAFEFHYYYTFMILSQHWVINNQIIFLLHKAPCWSDLHSNSVKLLKGPFNSEEEIWQRSNFHQSRSEEFHTAVKHQMNFTRVELWPLTFSGGVNTGEDPPGSAGKTFIILNISQHLKMDRWTPEFKILTNIETQ